MIPRDPKCVFVANDVAQATVVANWLETQGIAARVMDSMTLGGLEGLNPWTGVSARGIEVWVVHPDDVERALELVDKHEASRRDRAYDDVTSRPVLVFCEECGSTTEFSAEQRDTTQTCPQCGTSLSVSEGETGGEELLADRAPKDRRFEFRSLQKVIILIFLAAIALYLSFMVLISVF